MRISDWSSDVCSSDLGVEEGDAEVDRAVDRPRRLVHVGDLAVENVATPDHRHAADADRGNLESAPERAVFHAVSPAGSSPMPSAAYFVAATSATTLPMLRKMSGTVDRK